MRLPPKAGAQLLFPWKTVSHLCPLHRRSFRRVRFTAPVPVDQPRHFPAAYFLWGHVSGLADPGTLPKGIHKLTASFYRSAVWVWIRHLYPVWAGMDKEELQFLGG